MIFGEKDQLAIEAEVEALKDRYLWGGFRFWLQGIEIGAFDELVNLRTSALYGRDFLRASARRPWPKPDATAKELLWMYHDRFVNGGGAEPGESWDRDPFLLDEIGQESIRDKFTVIALREGNGDRVIARRYQNETVIEVSTPPRVCEAVIRDFCEWVEHYPSISHTQNR